MRRRTKGPEPRLDVGHLTAPRCEIVASGTRQRGESRKPAPRRFVSRGGSLACLPRRSQIAPNAPARLVQAQAACAHRVGKARLDHILFLGFCPRLQFEIARGSVGAPPSARRILWSSSKRRLSVAVRPRSRSFASLIAFVTLRGGRTVVVQLGEKCLPHVVRRHGTIEREVFTQPGPKTDLLRAPRRPYLGLGDLKIAKVTPMRKATPFPCAV